MMSELFQKNDHLRVALTFSSGMHMHSTKCMHVHAEAMDKTVQQIWSPAYPVEFSGMHMHATPILCLLHTWWQGHAHACSEYFSYLPRRRGTKWLACMCIPRVPHENIHGACTCMHTVITWSWTNSCNKYNPFYRIFIGYARAYPCIPGGMHVHTLRVISRDATWGCGFCWK